MEAKFKLRSDEADAWVHSSGPTLRLSTVTGRGKSSKGNTKLALTRMAYEGSFNIVCEIASFNLPAGDPQGRLGGTCPGAGECEEFCYAQSHRYLFETVDRLRRRNHAALKELLKSGVQDAANALAHMVMGWVFSVQGGAQIPRVFLLRVHDSGDFFSANYMKAWAKATEILAETFRDTTTKVLPYAYTKSYGFRAAIKELVASDFRLVQSLESKWRDRIDWSLPVAATFPTDVIPDGWVNGNTKELGDLPAILGEHRIALPHHGVRGKSTVIDPLIQIEDRVAAYK